MFRPQVPLLQFYQCSCDALCPAVHVADPLPDLPLIRQKKGVCKVEADFQEILLHDVQGRHILNILTQSSESAVHSTQIDDPRDSHQNYRHTATGNQYQKLSFNVHI